MQWFGKPVIFNRFLGQIDQEDPTNLPVGPAALCRNKEFARDNGGVTCCTTRAGVNLAMQGANKAPITGLEEFVYQPELDTEVSFERPIVFDYAGQLYYESPVGTGHLVAFPASGLTPPEAAHFIAATAGNKLWGAFSDLQTPLSGPACVDPKALTVWPLGMKPFGWNWQPNTPVIEGEVCTPPAPSTGNGHTYQAQNSGITGAATPAFPTAEGATFADGGVTWKELTMVVANRLPAPPAPTLSLGGGGTFAGGLDVYARVTLNNPMGETLPSEPVFVSTVAAGTAVEVATPTLLALAGWIQSLDPEFAPTSLNVYVAAVATGNPAPPLSSYQQANTSPVGFGSTFNCTGPGTGAQPPSQCTARVTQGRLPTPDTEPVIERNPAAGAFPAGRDVYVAQTYTNQAGETKLGPANAILNTNANDGIQVTIAVPQDDDGNALYSIDQVGIYEADVPTGTPAPALTEFQRVGYYNAGATPIIPASAAGPNPPTANTTGPGGSIEADTPDGGINGTQGLRYAAVLFMNQNETVSGFTKASVVSCDVDEDGWELAVFNVATGPANIVARCVPFSEADGTDAGPFDWIGVVNLLVPSQNFVYPQTVPSGDDNMTATVLFDNVTTQAIFNFTDTYLRSSNDVTDRLRLMAPPRCARVDYLETADVLALTGVAGLNGGGLISIGSDYESFYADTGPLPIRANGEVCYGFTDAYRGIIFALRSGSGYEITPNTGDPSSWSARRRWGGEGPSEGVGPCGFRAWAACSKFIIFVHRTGIYKYEGTEEDLMTKEVPRQWSTINWAAAETIECCIDIDTHQVLIAVPTGASTVPNEVIALSYLEGWQNPLHFSPYSGKETAMDACRRYSFQDIAAFVIRRVKRTLPPGPAYLNGPDWETMPDSSFGVTQLLYGSSAADGAVQARTPGVFNDNGAGIDDQYETVSGGLMQAMCKPEGFNLNATGSGLCYASLLAARDMVTGPGEKSKEIQLRPIPLDPDQKIGITRKAPVKINEFWRVRFTNGKVPDAWVSLKCMTFYLIPFTAGRGEQDRGS